MQSLRRSWAQDWCNVRLAEYIPSDLELTSGWLVVASVQNNKVAMYADTPYNLLTVMAKVKYKGKKGVYPLIMWEDHAEPMMGGREFWGVPNLISNVSDITVKGKKFRGTADFKNHTFCEMDAFCS